MSVVYIEKRDERRAIREGKIGLLKTTRHDHLHLRLLIY